MFWVELCPPKKACCDSNPQAIRILPYSKIVVTHVISWDEVTLEQGRPLFWSDWCLYKRRRDKGRRTPRENTDTPGKCHVMTEAAAAGRARLKTDSHQQVQQARNDSIQWIMALQLLWFLTSPELLTELSVLLSYPKYWYLDHGIKPRILRVKNCVITGESK